MARLARVVVPGLPHHITQRGNRRQQTFFRPEDYALYLELMGQWYGEHGVQVWAYCLIPNHVHLIAVPHSADGLRRAIGEAHRRYTRQINFREGWRGHLWQGRFASFVMDEPYLLATARYVELNPVRAGLVTGPSEYPTQILGTPYLFPSRVAFSSGFLASQDAAEVLLQTNQEVVVAKRTARTLMPLKDLQLLPRSPRW